MKVVLRVVGPTQEAYLRQGEELFRKRLGHYLPFETEVIPDLKKAGRLSPEQVCQREGEAILSRLHTNDHLILLDERGKTYTSEAFAHWLEQRLQLSARRLVFQVGGAYGFSAEVYARANGRLALSAMTFSHQMVRLFFLEQLYRAMTILRNEPYHNR